MLISLWCIMSAHQGVKGHGYIGGFCGTGKLVQSRAVFHETSKNPRNEQKSKTSKNFSPFESPGIYIDIIYIYIPGWFCLPIITWSLFQNGILRIPKHQSKPRVDSFILLDPIGSYWLISYEIFISRWAIQDASEELNPLRRQWSPTSWQLSWHLVELVIQDCAWKLGLIPRSEGMIRGNSS